MSIEQLVKRMNEELAPLEAAGDARRWFLATYVRSTRAFAEEIERGGFNDPEWVSEWDLAFADLYLDALAADRAGGTPSAPWTIAFRTATQQPHLPPLRHLLLAMNAHINFDLPQALLAVISPADFDDVELLQQRARDHAHADEVLLSRVSAEDTELLAAGPRSLLDRLLQPLNRAGTKRFLVESRRKVWSNARLLDAARRVGEARYAARLAELEALSAAKLEELTAPGQVLLRLAVKGFGVSLPAKPSSRAW
jgi:Family of unknown function (DUF5995)